MVTIVKRNVKKLKKMCGNCKYFKYNEEESNFYEKKVGNCLKDGGLCFYDFGSDCGDYEEK